MAERKYHELQAKYNRLISQYNELVEQSEDQKIEWEKKEKQHGLLESKVAELCGEILSKDASRMATGKGATSWSALPSDQMIDEARKSFVSYSDHWKDITNKLLLLSTDRANELEKKTEIIRVLKEKVNFLEASGEIHDTKTLDKMIAQQKEEDEEIVVAVQNKGTASEIQKIKEENKDVTEEELALQARMVEDNVTQKYMSVSVPYSEAENKLENEKTKQKEAFEARVMDIKGTMKKIPPEGWKLIRYVGKEGMSNFKVITQLIIQDNDTGQPLSVSRLIRTGELLQSYNLFAVEKITTPLKKNRLILRLTEAGKTLYQAKYGEPPVVSEMESVIKNHDNLVHGYGIMDIYKLLLSSGLYKSVEQGTKEKQIPIGNGLYYCPDIICDTGKYKLYLEYELGTHTQPDFNAKCNKMHTVTKYMYFIVPNAKTLKEIMVPKLNNWIASREKQSLLPCRIFIATAQGVKDGLEHNNEIGWSIRFNLKEADCIDIADIK